MKKGLPTATVSILALTLAGTASAKEPYPGFDRDMALAFENDGEPMELALLSEQEMRETKGAVWPILGFFKGWVSRLFAGSAFGLVKAGADEHYNMYNSPIQKWRAANILYWGLAGVVAKNTWVGAAIGGFEAWNPNWGVKRIHQELLRVTRNGTYQNPGSLAREIGGAVDARSSSLYRDLGGSALSFTASQTSTRGSSGADLVQLLPQDALRNFLTSLPTRTMNGYLSGIDPDISRTDFLASLPPETVNKLILTLTERDMNNFVRIIPANIMQPVFDASPHTAEYWRPHWRT